jgi:tRNA modification GTPase
MNNLDTIYAVSSGTGMAGIALIRVSGPKARVLLADLATPLPLPRMTGVRQLRDPISNDIIDQALVLWMPGPRTATGEDVAEFHVHGSSAVIESLFLVFERYEGVRLAEAGEFTRRAFVNDRINLVEAEGLGDLLHARTQVQRRMAVGHMLGRASSVYENWQNELAEILAHVEAAIDFADEEGVAEAALFDVRKRTEVLLETLTRAVAQSDRAGVLRSGVKIVIGGAPNVGKSSLLNLIAAREAAIVSSKPGTTRDVIEVSIVMAGIPVILTDTAGLRLESDDEIEVMGMERARLALRDADVNLWVSSPEISADVETPTPPDMHIFNKLDLMPDRSIHIRNDSEIRLSALTGEGVDLLLCELEKLVKERFSGLEQAVVVRMRQKKSVLQSIQFLNESLIHDANHIELAAECLRKACHAMARITGRVDVEDLLGKIFSEFCIGK